MDDMIVKDLKVEGETFTPPEKYLKILTATKNTFTTIMEELGDLDCNVHITIVDGDKPAYNNDTTRIDIPHSVWQRNYNGYTLQIDGMHRTHNFNFYFLNDDYEKFCIYEQSINFQNIFGCFILSVHECFH